ncbi:MAG: Swt1 family HEPN domain-containing protein [Myxococcales bacterium]
MALSNHERVGKAVELLKQGLGPFVERELKSVYKDQAREKANAFLGKDRINAGKPVAEWDAAPLLQILWEAWHDVFGKTLGRADRTLVAELKDVRNRWAHQETFSSNDAYRALDSASRLLTAVSAPEAEETEKLKTELLRVQFEEQLRTEKRKTAGVPVESQTVGNLKPWREVVNPHKDVASGQYQQAEFAADLWQVHRGEGSDEYRHPVEFFRRTYLTESLKQLLVGGARRLAGQGGDPVVQLQTNFGGGKTHSMLALYHLFSGSEPSKLVGIDKVLAEAKVEKLPKAQRVVLVGNKISPGSPSTKPDGTVVRTLWGELAWQLGGKKAFKRVQADDEKATNPGDVLRVLFEEYGPCLILIDEWVAYARQLHEEKDLPAGTFETQFTFAQALSEAARDCKRCLLVVSLPASDTGGSPHIQADDVEVGGARGREALDRLRNVIGRVESSWRPATAEEGFEIVRRRLFEPLVERAQWVARDQTAREFYELYRTQQAEFPPDSREADYEERLKAAYPIHPELFDRLYSDWSTLVKFQRTRGVLRLMAAVIHTLWERGDKNPLIMPSSVPIEDPRVQSELLRYLSDNWAPVIEKDVDGHGSLPLRLDGEQPNLGKLHACRRVARTIYLGSAPTVAAAHQGLEDRRVKLGCVMPGESPAVFGDALRRLAAASTYLYQDGARYWYATQPTVTKVADDRAEQLKRDPDKVAAELERRIRTDVRKRSEKKDEVGFAGVHALPPSSQDVPDEPETRLVVLSKDHPYTKDGTSSAQKEAQAILETRGSAPRLYRNTLVFLAIDKTRLQDLDEAIRHFLAWDSVVLDREKLQLSPHQVKQAETQRASAERTVDLRLPEAYLWLLVPVQAGPEAPVTWQVEKLGGKEPLAIQASAKLKRQALFHADLGAPVLKMQLDRVPLWRGNHVAVKQLVEDYGRYLYLERLPGPEVLMKAIQSGLGLLSWEHDSFAYAESYDEQAKRYRGLQACRELSVSPDSPGLLVKAEVAKAQFDAEEKARAAASGAAEVATSSEKTRAGEIPAGTKPGPAALPKRFHGTVTLDPARVGRDASRVADEVISHLAGLVGAKVTVTLEIGAEVPGGAPSNVVRAVTENSKTLKFTSHGFEDD